MFFNPKPRVFNMFVRFFDQSTFHNFCVPFRVLGLRFALITSDLEAFNLAGSQLVLQRNSNQIAYHYQRLYHHAATFECHSHSDLD